MRRLKKSAMNKLTLAANFLRTIHAELDQMLVNTTQSLYQLVDINKSSRIINMMDEIQQNFPEALYNGKVYRKISLDGDEIFKDMGFEYYVGTLIDSCKRFIDVGDYQSTTKSYEFCKSFTPQADDFTWLQAIISFDATNGVDVQKLAQSCKQKLEKYMSQFDNEQDIPKEENRLIENLFNLIKTTESYKREQEVFTIVPLNYDFKQIGDIDISNTERQLNADEIYELSNGEIDNRGQQIQEQPQQTYEFDDSDDFELDIDDDFTLDDDFNLDEFASIKHVSRLKKIQYPKKAINLNKPNVDLNLEPVNSRGVIPITPDYDCYDYFKARDPQRLKRLKELHDNQSYQTFEDCVRPSYASTKTAKLKTLKDFVPNYYKYQFIEMGQQDVEVSKVVGLPSERVDDYNDDWTPKNPDQRWDYQIQLIENNKPMQPVPLVQLEDGNYCALGDGSHRIAAAHVMNLQTMPATVYKMSLADNEIDIDAKWKEYANDKLKKLDEMNAEYRKLSEQLPDLMFENPDEYTEVSEKVWALGDEISELDAQLIEEEKEFKRKRVEYI